MPRSGTPVLIDYDFGHNYPTSLIDHLEDLLWGLYMRVLPCLLLLLLNLLKTANIALEWSIVFWSLHGLNHLLVFPGSHGTFRPTTCAQPPLPLIFLLLALIPAPNYLNWCSCVQHLLHIKDLTLIKVSCYWQIVGVAIDYLRRHETWTLWGFMLRPRVLLMSGGRYRILCWRVRKGLSTSQRYFW
jgi:hypothetical protein